MRRIKRKPYPGRNHGSFADEWISHKKASEWWYATGYFSDQQDTIYSYQFTIIHPRVMKLRPFILHLGLTDLSFGKHYFTQTVNFLGKSVVIDEKSAQFDTVARVIKGQHAMALTCQDKEFSLDLQLEYGKGATWHCDDGFLLMGSADTKESTLYYSYTNMPTTGTLTLRDKTIRVTGKSWFDKQGGPYSLLKRRTHWEWFSLRFYDNEEVMLFTFPQNEYQDGTYIQKDGTSQRLTDYVVKPLEFVVKQGLKFSYGWTLGMPDVKEGEYTIKPMFKGQMNVGYFEQVSKIYNNKDEDVGICIAELLPGVYNEEFKSSLLKNADHYVDDSV